MNDPAYRFTVVFKDGRQVSQEDSTGKVVKDHCHISNEEWDTAEVYALTNRPGDHVITVNWKNGDFSINNTRIKMMANDLDIFSKDKIHSRALFKKVYGRKRLVGQKGQQTYFYCGWEATIDNKKIRRVLLVGADGTVFFDAT